jgi:hypothetical protein
MPITARPSTEQVLVWRLRRTILEDIMREWLVIGVGAVIGLTIGIVIGETFELSRIVAKIAALGGAVLGSCLAMGMATMAGWVKPISDNA